MSTEQTGYRWKVMPASGKLRKWEHEGTTVRLPVTALFEFPGKLSITVDIDLVAGEPQMTSMALSSRKGLDAQHLQRDFRWATPLRLVVQYLVARDDGTDKLYGKWQRPTAQAPFVEPNELDDDFLEQVARDYLDAGTRYSRVLADKYGVAPRSVIRWIDLARKRGILSRPDQTGRVGGHIVPKRNRKR